MKKFLLCAAALGFTAAAWAEGPNMVKNGSFDATGWEQSVPGDYSWEPWNEQAYLTVLPDWKINANVWIGGIEMKTGNDAAGDDETRPEDDMNYLHFVGFNDNGWGDIALLQKISGLTPGTKYTLSFAMAVKWPEGSSWTPEENYGFNFAEYDGDDENGIPKLGREISSVNIAKSDYADEMSDDWTVLTFDVTPTSADCVLKFYYNNSWGTGNKTDNKWMDLDCVKLFDPNGEGGDESGVAGIVSDENAPVEYYNLQGVRVNGDNLKGIYVKKQGSKTVKVAL